MADPSARLRRQVEKAAKRGRVREALDAQRELCRLVPDLSAEWLRLAAFARSMGDAATEANARLVAGKLRGATPAEWLELDALAAGAGLPEIALEARFRAAEAFARAGDPRRAIELCDVVLAVSPDHAAARRIRALMGRRLEQPAVPELPPLLVFGAPDAARAEPEPAAMEAIEVDEDAEEEFGAEEAADLDAAPSGEVPLTTTLRTSAMLEALRAATVDEALRADYVRAPQRWPSVLDWHSMLFVGPMSALDEDFAHFAQPLDVAPEQVICAQGEVGHVLYCLDEGEVSASRVRGFNQDFGSVQEGSFFGEAGAIAGLPCTTTVTALLPCRMRVITRDAVQRPGRQSAPRVARLIAALRSFYLDLAVSICPLLGELPAEDLAAIARAESWSIFKPGERIASQGAPASLQVIVVGMVRVTHLPPAGGSELHLGFLTTGDVVCDIDPCPVTATAEALTFTIAVEREVVESFPEAARADHERRIAECHQVLSELAAAQAARG